MEKPMSKLQILIFNVLLLLAAPIFAANIQVAVDRNPVSINDSFQITFTATQDLDGNPDFSPLEDHFEVLNQQRSSNSSWVNGRSSRTEQWLLNVKAKQSGELLIPPIAFGSDSSKPLKITVTENQVAPQSNDELFLDVVAVPEKPYVQSQVLYTLRIYRRVQIAQARLDEPQLKDAVVEKLGEDNNFLTQIKGVDYSVTERRYAIFPQQSGHLTIAPLTLSAEVVVQHQPRFNSFFNQQSTENRQVVSKAITLDVQAVPPEFKGAEWLSAESLTLTEEWSENHLQTTVGEPLTRTLKLSAKGATVGQLPELAGHPVIDGIKTYPDQPVLKEDKQWDGLTALREEKIALIPAKPGNYILPALSIQWFNTKTQRVETATLPSVTITAVAGAVVPQQQPLAQTADNNAAKPLVLSPENAVGDSRFWQVLSFALALGWLLTIIWCFRRLRKPAKPAKPAKAEKTVKPVSSGSADAKQLKRACLENNAQSAKLQLLQWGKAHFGVDSLGAIAERTSAPLSVEIDRLNQALYAAQAQAWQGEKLWQAFQNYAVPTNANAKPDNDELEPLYKL